MKTNSLNLTGATFVAAALLIMTSLQALSQPMTLKHCLVQSVDTTNMTITVKQFDRGESLVLYITSRTRLFRNGEPAITADFQAGDSAGGTAYKNAENKVEAVRIYAEPGKSQPAETVTLE